MTVRMIEEARRLAGFGWFIVVGAVVTLAGPGCASKEKVASNPASVMGGDIMPPPLTAAYDPARQAASGSAWASGPSAMPSASANGPDSTR